MNKQALLAETLYSALAEHQADHTGDFNTLSAKDLVEVFKVASLLYCMDQANNDPKKADKMWGLKSTYIRDRKKTAEKWGIDAIDSVDAPEAGNPESQIKASAALPQAERRGHRNEATIGFDWPKKVENYWTELDREELEGLDLEDQLDVLFGNPLLGTKTTSPSKMIELVAKDQEPLPMGAPDLGEDMPPKMPEIVKATAKYQNNLKDKIT